MTWDNQFTFEVSSADPLAAPAWVDLTLRVLDVITPVNWSFGRQNVLAGGEPGVLSLVLNNADGALTFGNTSSPYAAWWAPGLRCRLRERVGTYTVDAFAGFLQVPEEEHIQADVEQTVVVNAIDLLGRLRSGSTFVSTVAAHIAASGNGALVGYWPLMDAAEPFADAVGSTVARAMDAGATVPPIEQFPAALPNQGAPLPGDDVAPLLLRPGLNAGAIAFYDKVTVVGWPPYPSLAAGQVLTIVAWINAKADYPTGGNWTPLTLTHFDGVVSVQKVDDPAGDYFRITSPLGTLTGNVSAPNGTAAATDRYYMIGLRYGFTPNTLELWVDDAIYTATLSGVLAGPLSISQLDAVAIGSIAHLQLYIGSPTAWTREDFLAQRTVGLLGLDRQTTGERVRAVAKYAGLASTELSRVDPGVAVMSPARLAGLDAATAMEQAETTERGLLTVDTSGQLVFMDRRRLYNI